MTYYRVIEAVRQEFDHDRSRRLNKHTVLGHTGLRRAVAASAAQAGDSNWIRNYAPKGSGFWFVGTSRQTKKGFPLCPPCLPAGRRVSNESQSLRGEPACAKPLRHRQVGGDNGLACQLCLCGENFIFDKTEHLLQLLFEITAVSSEIMTVFNQL